MSKQAEIVVPLVSISVHNSKSQDFAFKGCKKGWKISYTGLDPIFVLKLKKNIRLGYNSKICPHGDRFDCIWLLYDCSKHFLAEGISNEMANYITMALDPNAGHTFALMNEQIENYQKHTTRLEEELETLLNKKNMTIVDLFHKIAIRCFYNNLL